MIGEKRRGDTKEYHMVIVGSWEERESRVCNVCFVWLVFFQKSWNFVEKEMFESKKMWKSRWKSTGNKKMWENVRECIKGRKKNTFNHVSTIFRSPQSINIPKETSQKRILKSCRTNNTYSGFFFSSCMRTCNTSYARNDTLACLCSSSMCAIMYSTWNVRQVIICSQWKQSYAHTSSPHCSLSFFLSLYCL